MKLLHAVVRFCVTHARDVTGRGATAVPHDFRATVPAPLARPHASETSIKAASAAITLAAASQTRNPAVALVVARH